MASPKDSAVGSAIRNLDLTLTLKVASTSEEIIVSADRPHGEAESINETRSADNLLQVMPAEVITSLPNANVADAVGRKCRDRFPKLRKDHWQVRSRCSR